MASGDIVGLGLHVCQPDDDYATLDTRAGASTPGELVEVYDFDDTTPEYIDLICRLEGYGGGGLTITFDLSAETGTTGAVRWGAAIRRINRSGEDIDAAHTYVYQFANVNVPGTSGQIVQASIALTDGAQMDSLADGEPFILRVQRDAANAADTTAGDAELWMPTLLIKET